MGCLKLKALCLLIGIGLLGSVNSWSEDLDPDFDIMMTETLANCTRTTTLISTTTSHLMTTSTETSPPTPPKTSTEMATTGSTVTDEETATIDPTMEDIQGHSLGDCGGTTTTTSTTESSTSSVVTSTSTDSSASSSISSSPTDTTSTTPAGTTSSATVSSTQETTTSAQKTSQTSSSKASTRTPTSTKGRWPWFTRSTDSTEGSTENTEGTEESDETETTKADSTTTGKATSTGRTSPGTSASSSTTTPRQATGSSSISSTWSSTSATVASSETTTDGLEAATSSFRTSTASPETSVSSSSSAGSSTATSTSTSVTSSEAKTSTSTIELTSTTPMRTSTTTVTPKSSTTTLVDTTGISSITTEVGTTPRKTTMETTSSSRTSEVAETKITTETKGTETTKTETTSRKTTPRTTEVMSTETTMTRSTPEETTIGRTSTEMETSATAGMTSVPVIPSTTVKLTTTQPEKTISTDDLFAKTSTTVTLSTLGTQGTSEDTSPTQWATSTVEWTTTSEEATTMKETTPRATTTVPRTSSDAVMTETTSQPITSTLKSTAVTMESVSSQTLTNSLPGEIPSTTDMERMTDEPATTEESLLGSSDMGKTETTEVGTMELSTTTDASLSVETSQTTSDGTTEGETLSSTEMKGTSPIPTSSPTVTMTELLVSTTAEMETTGTTGLTDAETESTEDEKTSSAVASATDRTTAETETAETETPLQTSASTIPTSSVLSSTVSTVTETESTTVTNVPTTVTETEKGTRATESTTEIIQSTRARTTDEPKPSTAASSTVQRTTPARTTTEDKDRERTRTMTTAEEKTTSTERIRTMSAAEDVKTTEKMSTATTTSEQTEAPSTRTTQETTAKTETRTQRATTTEVEEEATEDMRTAPVTTELKTEKATRTRTTEEATTEAQTGTSRLSTSVKSSLETMMDTETTESTTTTMTTTEATTTECPGECPEGWIVGGDRCYLHLEPGVQTIRVSVAKASCFHLGPFVGLAKQADMIRDRDVLWAAMAEKNLSTELFHVASENYLDQGGVLMGQAVNLSKLITIPDYIPVDVSVAANAFCVQGKFCGKLNCDIQDVFDVQFRYLRKPPKNLVLPYGERADFPCLPPSPDSMSVTCGSRGFLVPKVSSLKCRYPVGFTPFAGNHRNNENRTSCAECWERGTDECVAVEGNKFQCVCREGWHGFTCRKTWNRCEQNKGYCLNGGSCVHHMDQVSCDCPEGFIGTRCTLGVRNITLFGSDEKLGLLGFSTAGTLIACCGIAALFMLMKAVKIWSSLQFLPLVLDRTCPQDTYIFMRNLMLLLAKFSMIVLGRPDFIFDFENHYVCKMADVWVYYLYSSAILFMFWEAINAYEVLMELGSVEWGVDGNGDRRFLYGPKFRILTALVGPWFIVIPYTIVFWPEISWDHTCLGGMADVDFDSFSTLHWLLTGSFVWFIFCVWIYTLYMRKKWPEVYLQMEHQIETKRPLDTDKLERVQRNIHFPMLLSISTWIFYMTSIGSYFHTGQELGTLYGWASIIASVIHSGLNICQFVLIDDDALEEFMKIGVPRFPNLNWPRETPPRRFNHEELIAMKTGAPCEWKFHPSSTWYLSEPMRHSMHRKLASEYLKRRAAGKKIPECLETAHSWLANFVGEDPFSKQRTAVVEDFLVRVKEFDAEEIELEETEARAKGMQLLGIINATHLTEAQKRRRRKIKKDMGKLAEVLNFRFFPLDVGCTLEVLEDGGDLPGDARHWERKKPEHLPARMRHQLPFFRKEMAHLLETLREDDPIKEEFRRSEWSPGFEGTREDPNPFLLPGLAPYVELAYYDQLFNLKEAKDLADRAKSDHEYVKRHNENLRHAAEIAKNKKIRKEVAARRRAEGVEDADTDDDWHVAPFDCPNGPPPGFKKPVVTSMETMMKKFKKEQKAAKKKQKKKQKKEKFQSIPRSSRK